MEFVRFVQKRRCHTGDAMLNHAKGCILDRACLLELLRDLTYGTFKGPYKWTLKDPYARNTSHQDATV